MTVNTMSALRFCEAPHMEMKYTMVSTTEAMIEDVVVSSRGEQCPDSDFSSAGVPAWHVR